MHLTIGEIFNVKQPLMELSRKPLPVKTSLAVLKLIKKVDEHLIPAEQVRDGLIRTYGKAVNDESAMPGQMKIEPGDENWEKFNAEYAELISQETEVVIEPILLPETLEIEAAILMALEKFITI